MARRLALIAAVTAGLLVSSAGTASAANLYSAEYAAPDAVAGYARAADGSLAALPGSPFEYPASDPSGVIALAFTPDGGRGVTTFLFTGGLRGLTVGADGSIAHTGPVDGPSITGLAVSPDGRFAYAPTRTFSAEPPAVGILGYSIGANGSLTPISGSPFSSGQYGEVAITPDGRFLYGSSGGQLKHFAIGADGKLTEGSTSTPFGARYLTPSPDSRFLFAGQSSGVGGVTSFSIGADGSLTQNGTPALTGSAIMGYFAVAPDGRHLYMPDANDDDIDAVTVADDGKLTVIDSTPLVNPDTVAVAPDGRFLYYSKSGVIGVASISADDGKLTILPMTATWNSGEPERILFLPAPAPEAHFTSVRAVPGKPAAFDASGSTRAARFDWDFGDGTTLPNGGPTPTHTYAAAGVYNVHLTVSDAQGCSTRQVYTGQSTDCPGGSSPTAAGSLDTLPVLSRLRVTKPRLKFFRYRLGEDARVRITIARKKGSRFRRVGVIRTRGHTGANRKRFAGRLHHRKLRPGRYRATAVATDSAGGKSSPKRVRFRILRPRR